MRMKNYLVGKFQKKEEKEEKVSEYEPEEYYMDFLKYTKHSDTYHAYIVCPVKNFIYQVENWFGQRELNEDHIQKLQRSILENKYVMGSFKILLSSKKKQLKLIDGQHRCVAIQNIIEKHPQFNPMIMIEAFYVDDVDSKESVDIFVKVNTSLVFNDMPNIISLNIVKKLSSLYDPIIDVVEGKKCYRPQTSKKKLQIEIKKLIEKTGEKSEEELINKIIKKNIGYASYSRREFNSTVPQNKLITERMYVKSHDSGWYLGLFPTLNWLNTL